MTRLACKFQFKLEILLTVVLIIASDMNQLIFPPFVIKGKLRIDPSCSVNIFLRIKIEIGSLIQLNNVFTPSVPY